MEARRTKSLIFASWLLVLVSSAVIASAAQKQLSSGHVPAIVAQKKIAPLNRLPGTNELRLALALPLRDPAGLTNFLRELYDPASPQFHHFLTPPEFAARFGPAPADYAAVMNFAKTNGFKISGTHPDRLVVDVAGKVSDVERAFHVRLNSFKHPKEKRNFFAPDAEPSLDAALPIFHVSGLDNFSLAHPNVKLRSLAMTGGATPCDGSGPSGTYMGGDFRQAYAPGAPLDGTGQNVALVQFDGFYADDITNYESFIGLTNPPQVVVMPVAGGVTNVGGGDDEVSLDIEMVLAMAPGVSNIFVYEATNGTAWVDVLSQIADDDLAAQVSTSWSGGGPDLASEIIFQQMAVQGQSFFNATGDSDALIGEIEFPSDSPNITQVGGTTLTTDGGGNYVSETVWNWGFDPYSGNYEGSSGGSSTSVPIPSWQVGLGLNTNQASMTRRNLPDVALTADNVFLIYSHGTLTRAGGTSCAAPLWAGFTALANQQAAQASQPPVGFLNPAIYALCRGTNYAPTFNDITAGNNTNGVSPNNFYAAPGYDLCTGWGTPNGTNLINALTTPDSLLVSPQTNFCASGFVGGPFTQTAWTIFLTNTGAASLDWSLGGLPSWLSVSANAGTLAAGGVTNLCLQLSGAENLPAGNYPAAILVTNEILSRVESLGVQLDIGASIVRNGGFETGDFTSWTLVGDTQIGSLIYNAVATDNDFSGPVDIVHSGNFGAFLGESGFLATLTQTLPTDPDRLYQLSFWLDNPASGPGQEFIASWNGTNLVDLASPPAFGWTNFQFVVTALATNTDLQFAARNDANYFGLDDVSVTPVPPVAFENVNLGGGGLQINWNSLAGLNYEVDYATNLAPANWQPLATITATTNFCGLADTNIFNGDSQRFYRLLLLP